MKLFCGFGVSSVILEVAVSHLIFEVQKCSKT